MNNDFPSKSKIDKAGEILKLSTQTKHSNPSLLVLSKWRSYHSSHLNAFTKTLKRRAKSIGNGEDILVAQRLKRTSSIQLKLRTHKTMRLSTMQDIGGARAILKDTRQVYELYNKYKKAKKIHKLFTYNDYIREPKQDGYRGIHLIYKLNKQPSLFIEIQIRSYLQHVWATGVEVFGTLKNTSFKSGYGEKEWIKFFLYLSAIFAMKEETPLPKNLKKHSKSKIISNTKSLIKKLNIIEQLNVYTAVYELSNNISTQGRKGNYSLIVLDSKNKRIQFKNFSEKDLEKANSEYIKLEEKYLNDSNINIVLVNTSDIKNLKKSYPNYFMDTKILTKKLSKIILDDYLNS